jgi:hypothetical protein
MKRESASETAADIRHRVSRMHMSRCEVLGRNVGVL